jgi:predicted small lipoprotein YifL
MCRAYQEPARASTALFAAVFAALVACDGQGFLRLNPSDVMTAHLDLAPA